jgi:Recombinase
VARIRALHVSGVSSYAIARTLNAEDTRTRYGKEFTTTTVQNILRRCLPSPKENRRETACPELSR